MIRPKMKIGWWQENCAGHLQQFYEDMQNGLRPIVAIQAPPQMGKSEQVQDFISWISGIDPETRSVFASYSEMLGVRANTNLQRLYPSQEYQEIFPDTQINSSNVVALSDRPRRNSSIIEYVNHKGYFRNTTVMGSVTGESLDCLVAGTLIDTNLGRIPIEELTTKGIPVKILSYINGGLKYENMQAFARNNSIGIYRITTESGRVLEASGNHRIYAQGKGWISANILSSGDVLLCAVPKKIHTLSIRCKKMDQGKRCKNILLQRMSGQTFFRIKKKKMQGMWKSGSIRKQIFKTLQIMLERRKKKPNTIRISSNRKELSNLFNVFYFSSSRTRKICGILFKILRSKWSFKKNVWPWKSYVETWRNSFKATTTFSKGFPVNKINDIRKRQPSVCCMWAIWNKIRSSSLRQLACEQFIFKSCHAMLQRSRKNASVAPYTERLDRVISVERICEEAVTYDIQVENSHNFFANGILVHNCGIIDDPLKGRAEASSTTVRDRTWNWLTNDFYSRFSENAGLLIVMTRWHLDDPVGRLKKQFPKMKIISYKAIAVEDEEHRKKGEPLFPEHKSLDFLLERKNLMMPAHWEAVYQQEPVQESGVLFENWQHLKIIETVPDDIINTVRYWDKAGTEGGGCYTAGVKIALTSSGRYIILDVTRGQWGAVKREEIIKQTAELDGTSVKIWIEQEPGSGGKESAENTIRRLNGWSVEAERPSGNKALRAEPYAVQVENSNVYIMNKSWTQDFIDEHKKFPQGEYKDQIDATSGGFNKLAMPTIDLW